MLFLLLISSFFSCEKAPQIVTNTVVSTDTLTLPQLLQDTATTFLLVRHAEKESIGSDPNLTPDGHARAEALMRVLKNIPLSAVFSTNYNRTQQTALPTANDQGLSVQSYDPALLDPLVDGVLQNHPGGAVLVVGHSNTIPGLLNFLTGTNAYPDIPDSQFDNLYIVSVYEKGKATVLHLKYGVATP
ncbi:MAG: histidine phosphatase family protein [Saprospiraceae bacterium]|nr:histidine phosphatase family protein [Saprospiraceae bacterium]MCF8249964.1 histidine phosphatase family protein [Saprospiraceae bacterium]MCF8278996.1 histidine phosphatase family protein [Bacteroidales bacterium]MCF8310977.1 histidine phosphatase family protein [Saprospiraceae bacterium]MCF8439687.1 histidine phosphatase family protein [Saprospiraceae bacterium]